MILNDYLSAVLLIAGGLFFLAGTLGLLRFPDIYSRLHALTKADNVGPVSYTHLRAHET